jgi:threonine/homoserine/homoserine lactone efflux protein
MPFVSEVGTLLLGWVIGLLIAMPVGAVAALAVKRTLHAGWPTGVATGLGAATADTIYAAIAAFGVYAVQDFLINHQYTLRVIGGAALLFVGINMLWQKSHVEPPIEDAEDPDAWHRIARGYITGTAITLTNPLTLIAFLTIFTNFGLTKDMHSYKTALFFVAGAFLGAATWWLSLVGGVTLIKARISDTLVAKINSVLAVFLMFAGGYAILTGIFEKPITTLLR